jgi:hypothetical protein
MAVIAIFAQEEPVKRWKYSRRIESGRPMPIRLAVAEIYKIIASQII